MLTKFSNSLKSELKKVTSLKSWWILALVLFGYTAILAVTMALFFTALAELSAGTAEISPLEKAKLVYTSGSSLAYVIPVIFGTLITTQEFRHRSLNYTFLAEARRNISLLAKVTVAAIFGAIYGLLSLIAAVVPGAIILEANGSSAMLAEPELLWLFARVILAFAIWAAIGVGLGALVVNQINAVVILLGFTQFVEPILRMVSGIWEWSAQIGKFLPGAASDSLIGAGLMSSIGALDPNAGINFQSNLSWWQGGLVLLAFCIISLWLAAKNSWKRDVS